MLAEPGTPYERGKGVTIGRIMAALGPGLFYSVSDQGDASREAARLAPSVLRVLFSKSAGESIPSVEWRRRGL